MKSKLIKGILAIGFSIIVFSNFYIVNDSFLIRNTDLKLVIQQALADGESGGGSAKHSQVVGCGARNMENWVAGCCAGTGGCTNHCHKTPVYCD